MPNHTDEQTIYLLMNYWEKSSTFKYYIARFLQDLTSVEIQKNMDIAFKEEPGHFREYERVEKFILLCHNQISYKRNISNEKQ